MRASGRLIASCALLLLCLAGPLNLRAQVLVWSTGNSLGGTQSVANYLTASGSFSSVTAFDGTRVLSDLTAYQAILFFTNSNSSTDPVAIGNTLAAFANSGRGLVLATFSWANQGSNTLGGDIITQGLSPFVFNGTSLYTNVTMASNTGGGLFNGVTSLNGYYHDAVTLTSGSTLLASWSDGRPLEAQRGNIIGINLFPDATAGSLSGNYQALFSNAVLKVIPEPATAALFGAGLAVLGLRRWRRRR